MAVALNVDTIHVINKLSQDSALRAAIVNNADRIATSQAENPKELDEISNQVKEALNGLTLPIGWERDDIYIENTLFPNWFLKGLGGLQAALLFQWGLLFGLTFLTV